MTPDDLYMPLEEAKKEIQRRWDNKDLQKKVEEFLGNDIPHFLLDSPKAFLARHIASPNFEFFRFLDMVEKLEMDYVIPEHLHDKFHSANSVKYHLGRMFIYKGKDKKGGHKIETETIIDFNKSNGKKFTEMVTMWDEDFIDFHHRILKDRVCDSHLKIHNLSDWLKKMGGAPEKFYLYFLALFIRNGILFENFLTDSEEKVFTVKKVMPSVKLLLEKFGVKPIIVRLLPKESEEDIYWLCYNDSVKKHIK